MDVLQSMEGGEVTLLGDCVVLRPLILKKNFLKINKYILIWKILDASMMIKCAI